MPMERADIAADLDRKANKLERSPQKPTQVTTACQDLQPPLKVLSPVSPEAYDACRDGAVQTDPFAAWSVPSHLLPGNKKTASRTTATVSTTIPAASAGAPEDDKLRPHPTAVSDDVKQCFARFCTEATLQEPQNLVRKH